MTRQLRGVLALLALGACSSEPSGVPVGEAAPVAPPSRPRPAALDTVYADSLTVPDDTVAVGADTLAVPPDPAVPLGAVQRAVRTDRRGGLDAQATGVAPSDLDLLWVLVESGPFRDGLLALAPRDLRREGSARVARVVVGYDVAGRVVPQDEAESDRTLGVRFDVVDGAYRVVGVDLP